MQLEIIAKMQRRGVKRFVRTAVNTDRIGLVVQLLENMPHRFFCLAVKVVAVSVIIGVGFANAQEAKKRTLAICEINPTQALAEQALKVGKKNEMDRVIQSLDGQLIDRINNTRKFDILAHSDLPAVLKGGTFSPGTLKGIPGLSNVLTATVDSFQDITRTDKLAIQKEVITVREIRLSVVGKIYETETSRLLESANFQTVTNKVVSEFASANVDGNRSDDLLVAIARDMAEKIANRVADVVFPAKILAQSGSRITINRGEGTGIEVGQVWIVFTQGEELKDPDTGEKLGREENPIGKATIIGVQPKTSTAELSGENLKVVGAILRLPPKKSP